MPMIEFRNAKYVISCPNYSLRPKDNLGEIVFIGKSNVGKSTLINLLTCQKLAYSSKSAGKTKLLNYFLIDNSFYLVDSPGYGFTKYGSKEDTNFGEMMEEYFSNPKLKGAVLLLDIRRRASEEDLSLISLLKEEGVPLILVYTKSDKAKQQEIALAKKEGKELSPTFVCFSSLKEGRNEIRKAIASLLQ